MEAHARRHLPRCRLRRRRAPSCAVCGRARPTVTRPAPRPDAKSALQEWAQGQGLALPAVRRGRAARAPTTRRASPRRCASRDARRRAGEGASKRAAEQAAARALLEREGVAGANCMSDENGEHRPPPDAQRCGFVAIIGAPNAGKSTLVNALVGAKVSIVSHKVQTTRVPLRGIATEGDEPARLHRHARRLRAEEAPRHAPWWKPPGAAPRDADIVVLVIDAAQGHRRGGRRHSRKARGCAPAAARRAQQDRQIGVAARSCSSLPAISASSLPSSASS